MNINIETAQQQIAVLEKALADERGLRSAMQDIIKSLEASNAQAASRLDAMRSDVWSIDEVRQALDAVSRTGSEFVIRMDQKLRTSLNGLLGMIELLVGCDLDETEYEYAICAKDSGQDLLHMFNEVLAYCRVDTGQIDLDFRPTTCTELMLTICEPFREKVERAGIGFSLKIGSKVREALEADSRYIKVALEQLLENAVENTTSGEITVDFDVARGGGEAWLKIAVIDTGAGIAAEDLVRVLNPFESGGLHPSNHVGLGLNVSSRVVEALGGRLDMTSELGKGTRATLTIPLSGEHESVAPEASQERSPSEASRRPRILVVEDNVVNQKVAKGFLERLECEVATAGDGLVALDMLKAEDYDLIVMDCMMPELDGYGATQKIRGGEAGETQSKTPIVALTADDSTENRRKCLRSGMDDYMSKPVRIDILRKMLRTWLPAEVRPPAA